VKRKNFSFLLLLFALGGMSKGLHAQSLQQNPALIKGKLKNGFTYYIYPNNNPAQQSVLRLLVNAGSLQEEDDQQGLAHFVEHMAFNGTKHYSKNEVISFLESKGVKFGADLNAHTSFDETSYKIAINTEQPQNLDKAIDIMANWAFNITFDSLEIEKERGVIVEEWRSKQGAENRLRDQYLPVLFHESRYAARMPIGKLEILHHFRRQRIVDFYEKWYRPELMSIVVVTNIDPKQVERSIRKLFGKYTTKEQAPRQYYSLPAHRDTLVAIVTDKEATSTELSFFTKMPSLAQIATEPVFNQYLLRVFLNNLSKNRFGRVSQLDNDFKSGSLSVTNIVLKNAILGGGVSLYKNQLQEGMDSYLYELERIFRYGYTKEEIEKLKKEYLQQLQKSAETDKTLSSTYADAIEADFYEGNTLITRQEKLRLVTQLLPGIDSLSLLQQLRSFRKEGNTVLLLTAPEQEQLPNEATLRSMLAGAAGKTVTAWHDAVEVPAQLLPTTPVAGKIIQEKTIAEIGVTEWTLSNGVTVYVKPSKEQKKTIMLSGFREGGIYAVDSTKFIPALFTKSVLAASGAGNFSRRALSQYLAGNSASATMVLSNSREGVVGGADLKDAATMFQLLYLKWTAPRMDTAVFAKMKQQAIDNAENGKVVPTYAYNRTISRLLGGEDYVSDTLSATRIRSQLNRNEIIPVFESRFHSAKGFQFVIVGDFETDSLRQWVSKYIASLPSGELQQGYVYKGASGGTKAEDVLMYAGQSPRSTVNLFFQSNEVQYDYPAIVQQELLEEVLKVKLRMNLREENSGVYGVGVSVSSTNKPAPLLRARINFTCAPESAAFLADQAKKEVARIASDAAYFTVELERIKVQLLDQYKKQAGKNTFWSAGLRNHFYYGFTGWDYFNDYEKLLNNVSAAQVSALADKYLVRTPCIKAVLMPAGYEKTSKTNN
jgi:zinc protease